MFDSGEFLVILDRWPTFRARPTVMTSLILTSLWRRRRSRSRHLKPAVLNESRPIHTQLDCRGARIARPNACQRRGRQRRISKHYLSNRCFYLSNGACARCESGSITRVAWVKAAKAARCGQFPTLSTPKYAKCTRSIVSRSESSTPLSLIRAAHAQNWESVLLKI